ncbi:FadR/GntR family transcriptional regulator [Ammoniphilus resinae]|uniref:DNA-binding FadR family transcriptional regulator n=1 Tax=Ammoniphilus resinae TaxID=861532 RepID=A0ABS4GX44_9BACL|nr:FadR/GntR family transcriptional regulator [Ammoniphilus resinae]MBP1934853.1 DNA-binding FadR family transcriptional regulator [Ammoniphilus resinae]
MSNELSTSDKVYDYIMEKIVSKEWKPKMKIMSENQLCNELNVSRISVRHALGKLVALGILSKKQGYGTVVNEMKPSMLFRNLLPIFALNENDIKAALEFRIHFEPSNVIMFMKNCTPSKVAELKEIYEQMKINYNNQEKFYLYDYNFHNYIAKGTNNPIVKSISDIMHSVLQYNVKQMNTNVGSDIAIYYHQAILNAIENQDAELAALLMRRHLEEILSKL